MRLVKVLIDLASHVKLVPQIVHNAFIVTRVKINTAHQTKSLGMVFVNVLLVNIGTEPSAKPASLTVMSAQIPQAVPNVHLTMIM